MEVIGTCKIFLENEVLASRKMVEAAVIEGEGSKETLISLELKKWDLIQSNFHNRRLAII